MHAAWAEFNKQEYAEATGHHIQNLDLRCFIFFSLLFSLASACWLYLHHYVTGVRRLADADPMGQDLQLRHDLFCLVLLALALLQEFLLLKNLQKRCKQPHENNFITNNLMRTTSSQNHKREAIAVDFFNS
jgi:hypothetical protein